MCECLCKQELARRRQAGQLPAVAGQERRCGAINFYGVMP